MKIVRSERAVDLRSIDMDGFDMYLLSRLDEPMTLDQLLEICPCEPLKTLQAVTRLAELRLVDLLVEGTESEALADAAEERPTLRPLPLARTKLAAATQGRPFRDLGRARSHSVSEDALTLRPPPPLAPFEQAPTTGVRSRPTAPNAAARSRLGSR